MAAGKYTFIIEQGVTTDFEIRYKDANNTPIDLSGFWGRMQIRATPESATPYITLSSSLNPDGTGLNFSGSDGSTPLASGSIGIYIAACSSSALSFSEAYYDLELYSGDPSCPYVSRLLEGKVKLSKEITR